MGIKVVIHNAAEGGYWAEVLFIPGCATQGESFEEFWRISTKRLKVALLWISAER